MYRTAQVKLTLSYGKVGHDYFFMHNSLLLRSLLGFFYHTVSGLYRTVSMALLIIIYLKMVFVYLSIHVFKAINSASVA